MQDIVFYAVANETLGSVRDYANARKKPAPILTLGVSVCLRMRLFAAQNDATPYPIDSFSGIVDWQWRMDNDFDRNTACKLVADPDSISVHTANDAFDGSTLHFTEFVIPISNMNTQELATWIGNEKRRSGLTGELVGYDSAGNAVFVLQIENFTIRNRVAGLGNPSAMDQEVVTRTQAESLIQAAVSASADTKQDKLNSSNAGTGISISSNGVISTANVPQSAVTGLSASLSAKQDSISAGDLMEISGTTVNRKRYMNIIPDSGILMRSIMIPNSTTTVSACVLEPGNAYKINAVSSARWLATTAAFKGSTGMWGIEGHIKLFVAGTGYVRTDSNVVLANALEPDAVNNCTVRFHDGIAIIAVEDHVAGYIVVNGSTSGDGSLYYGITTSTNDYVAFDASLNGQTIPLAGAVAEGEKHIVGNGYTETAITGAVDCGSSKFTVANLGLNNVQIVGGIMTLGDAFIPSGSTVAVSGGGLAVEKVTGDGGVIDLANGSAIVRSGADVYISGCTMTNGNKTGSGYGGGILVQNAHSFIASNALITGNSAGGGYAGGGLYIQRNSLAELRNCNVTGNVATYGGDIAIAHGGLLVIGGTIGNVAVQSNGILNLAENVKVDSVYTLGETANGKVVISSGAIIDLTGNTNPAPIAPGGGITFEPGGATVLYSSGAVSGSYMMDNVTLPAGAKLTNTNVVNLGGASVNVSTGSTVSASGCTFSGGSASGNGGAIYLGNNATADMQNISAVGCFSEGNGGFIIVTNGAVCMLTSATIVGCSATYGGGIRNNNGGTTILSDCIVSGNNTTGAGRDISIGGGTVYVYGGAVDNIAIEGGEFIIADNTSIGLVTSRSTTLYGSVTITSGAILDITGNTNTTPIAPGGGITFVSGGNKMIRYGSGTSSGTRLFEDVEIRGSSISNLGIIYGATVYFPESHGPLDVWYTTDSGTTSSSVQISGGTPTFVVDGGLVSVES